MNNYLIHNISWRGNLDNGFRQELGLAQGAELKNIPLYESHPSSSLPDSIGTGRVTSSSYQFKLQLSEERHCPGFISKDGYQFCRINSKLSEKQTLCGYCEKIQGFKSSFLFGQEPNENAKEIMESVHYIYLAYFPNGIIKVGTAVESRKYLRPLEQDAYACVLIAKSTGFKVQELEHAISSKLKITEFVKSEVKYKNILNKLNFDRASEELMSMYKKIRNVMDRDFSEWFIDEPELDPKNLAQYLFIPDREIVKVKDLNLVGTFKGIRGRYLIMENENYDDLYLVFDIRDLIGREILGEVLDYRYNLHQQFSLGI